MHRENPKTQRILVVDDEPRNIKVIESYLTPFGYEVIIATNGHQALQRIDSESVDLVILDVMLQPGIDGLEVCRRIKQTKWQSLPVILVTALTAVDSKVIAFECGADDFLSKPVHRAELLARVKAHLRIKTMMDQIKSINDILEEKVRRRTQVIIQKNKQLTESYHLILDALVNALDVREHETGKHSIRVTLYTLELIRTWADHSVKRKELEEIAMGALLHDVGKIGTPDGILLKPGKLTEEEWVEMKKHPQVGWEMIKEIEFIGRGRDLVLSHHERQDGKGYPRGLQGGDIYIGAKFFAVADTLDAMTSNRPYRQALPFEAVETEVKRCKNEQFDPRAVASFLAVPKERWRALKEVSQQSDFRAIMNMTK